MKNKKTRILLVEDSQNLRMVLKDYFEMRNYKVIDFENGETAVRSYRNGYYDICLLDIGLPKKDGYAVMKELRTVTPDLPVIFITAKDTKEDKIKGFKAGCDDYVTKPFSTEELLFRMEAVLKRTGINGKNGFLYDGTIFNMGEFTFNFSELKLIHNDQVRMLTKKEASLLKILYEHKNKLVPREILLKEIWGESKATLGRSLDVYLSKLRFYLITDEKNAPENISHEGGRRKRDKFGYEPKVEIMNVHGVGYLLKVRA